MSHTYKTYAPLTRAAILRAQNDVFRVERSRASVHFHRSVDDVLGPCTEFFLLEAVAFYDAFTDDPEDTHDHGMFELAGVKVFWRIFYRAYEFCGGDSPDPADVHETRRSLHFKIDQDPITGW